MLTSQLEAGEDYWNPRPVVGIHLLDFDLFTGTCAQRQQAVWRFEMRDDCQPEVTLGNQLQLTLVELKKADRLQRGSARLRDWVRFFEHWQEEQTKADIKHAPIQDALHRVRQPSADEEARRQAFVRERALHDEVTLLREAREEGREAAARETACKLIALGLLTDAQIAEATRLTVEQVEALRSVG